MMSTGTLGGLSGKARHVRDRSYADQRFADCLIAEYHDPRDQNRRRAADAPIRGRSEFMPSFFSESEMTEGTAGPQLELSWDDKSEPDTKSSSARDRRIVWSTGADARGSESAVERIKIPSVAVAERSDREGTFESRKAVVGPVSPSVADPVSHKPASGNVKQVIRIERRTVARMPIGWSQSPAKPSVDFSLRGFVRGCAIGGVAAAAVLAVLSIALG